MAIDKRLLDDLERRQAAALASGGPERIAKRHAKGQLTARERLEGLYAEHTFQEFGLHAQHQTRGFGMERSRCPPMG